MDYIVSAKHICDRDRAPNLKAWNYLVARRLRGLRTPYTGQVSGLGVTAIIENGRWIAGCIAPNCNGYEYVRPDEPIFYCFSCGNAANDGHARPVVFPENWQDIEAALLVRPIMLPPLDTELNALINARAINPNVSRWWAPPTTLDDLLNQNREAGLN